MYVVVDRESRNLLGEFESLQDAEEMRRRFTDSDPAANLDIVLAGGEETDAPPELRRPADA
jgi:hypothetical protein